MIMVAEADVDRIEQLLRALLKQRMPLGAAEAKALLRQLELARRGYPKEAGKCSTT